jgi:hypothetical protein
MGENAFSGFAHKSLKRKTGGIQRATSYGVLVEQNGGITIRLNHMIPLEFYGSKASVFWMMWPKCDSIFCGLLYFTRTEN